MKKQAGFSLIELVFSVAIMGLLMAMMLPQLGRVRDQAMETSVKAVAMNFQTALESYAAENYQYPDSSYPAADLAGALIDAGIMTTVPLNPFTQKTYLSADQMGRISYAAVASGLGYVLTAYKRDGSTVLLTIAGGTQS